MGPRADAARIPGIDVQVGDGDSWRLGSLEMRVFDTPGHTRGHICLWFPEAKALFAGELPAAYFTLLSHALIALRADMRVMPRFPPAR